MNIDTFHTPTEKDLRTLAPGESVRQEFGVDFHTEYPPEGVYVVEARYIPFPIFGVTQFTFHKKLYILEVVERP